MNALRYDTFKTMLAGQAVEGRPMADLVIVILKRLRCILQRAASRALRQEWQSHQVFAVQEQQVEQEEDQRPLARIAGVLDQVESRSAARQDPAEFGIEVSILSRSPAIALAMKGYLSVQSLPRRVKIWTRPASSRACIRYPSSLISCSQSGPSGTSLTSAASCGFTQVGRDARSTLRRVGVAVETIRLKRRDGRLILET
jgi:hypothetical protein